jgi:hypothetical protein
MTIREEFEPQMIGPKGHHDSKEACAKDWDSSRYSDVAISEEIVVAEAWLRGMTHTAKINTAYTSYGLKHMVERWSGDYVCNGAFIMAAVRLGFQIQYIQRSPNVWINVAGKSVSERGREAEQLMRRRIRLPHEEG